MQKCPMAALLLLLMLANRSHPADTSLHQPPPALQNATGVYERNTLQNGLSGGSERQAVRIAENEVGEEPGRGTSRRAASWTAEVKAVCDCLASHSGCGFGVGELGPVIIDGTCDSQTHGQRRAATVRGDTAFSMATFPGKQQCEGALPLVLMSTGEQRHINLTNVPSVWVCPGSLYSSLQQLTITDVPEVKIAPGALSHRLEDITLNLTGLTKTLFLPEGALSLSTVKDGNVDDMPIEVDLEKYAPPQVKVLIENAKNVTFDSKSVLAPRVSVVVRAADTVKVETQALVALAYPTHSAFHVFSTRHLFLGMRAVNVTSLWVTNTTAVLLKEESLEMILPHGEVILRNVAHVVAPQKAIIMGSKTSLEMSNITFIALNRHALVAPSPLRSIVLRDVVLPGSTPMPLCLTSHTLLFHNITAKGWAHNFAAVCVKFMVMMEVERSEWDGLMNEKTVLCQAKLHEVITDSRTCADPSCGLCDTQSTAYDGIRDLLPPISVQLPTTPRISSVATFAAAAATTTTTTTTTTTSTTTTTTTTATANFAQSHTTPGEDTEGVTGLPLPLMMACALALVVAVLLLAWCFYTLYRRTKRAKYELPQPLRTRTFPRTIITPDTLSTPTTAHHAHIPGPTELFFNYQQPHRMSPQRADIHAGRQGIRSHVNPDRGTYIPHDTHLLATDDQSMSISSSVNSLTI